MQAGQTLQPKPNQTMQDILLSEFDVEDRPSGLGLNSVEDTSEENTDRQFCVQHQQKSKTSKLNAIIRK